MVDEKHTAFPSAVVAHGMVVPDPLLSPAHAGETGSGPGSLPPAPLVLLAPVVLLALLAPVVLLALLAPVVLLAPVLLVLLAPVVLLALLALPAPAPVVAPPLALLAELLGPGSPPPAPAAPPAPSSPSDDEQASHPQVKKPSITKERIELM
ncbi:hypothetical protein [Sorangium sp. So ce1078]|uniref:hypothetical protein n=1 Tax=Sorangium sp. So ce1078 TaxID=3133329 RepID=UPI003F5F10D9